VPSSGPTLGPVEGRKLAFAGGEVACQVLRPAASTGSTSWSSTSTTAGGGVGAEPYGPGGWSTTGASGWTPMSRWWWPRSTQRTGDLPRAWPPAQLTTMVLVTALAPLPGRRPAADGGVRATVGVGAPVSRDAGARGAGTRGAPVGVYAAGAGGPLRRQVWGKPIAQRDPLAGSVKEAGYTSRVEAVKETRKILHDDSIGREATCVRVPVFVGHHGATSSSAGGEQGRGGRAAVSAPGVVLVDGGDGRRRLDGAGIDPCWSAASGRTRRAPVASTVGPGDNLRKARPSTPCRWPADDRPSAA